jgi:hypothetical protein
MQQYGCKYIARELKFAQVINPGTFLSQHFQITSPVMATIHITEVWSKLFNIMWCSVLGPHNEIGI